MTLPELRQATRLRFVDTIANGIGVGFVSWVVLQSVSGKARAVSPLLWVVAAGFLLYFARDVIAPVA